ncbi:MAG: DUF262 domain-containing protein [Evtepia gabavorous]|uniref:DUF262 domain-containing protein n=1 Tax=Evtepia gabavorous TaxID=2211183 RepID=UPI0023F52481|nr:DUF262 domain-containing protein [Evtepia gabavorous]
MPDLLGIIVPLRKFLSNSVENITLTNSHENILVLEKGRRYVIPDFQREIRWDQDNVEILLDDLESGSKYLGNIILTQQEENIFSIIDGQQRITILTMILTAILRFHGDDMDVLYPCKLQVDSFFGFEILLDSYFASESLEDQKVCESDHLHQKEKYFNLWKCLIEDERIRDKRKAKALLENLEQSNVNLILNRSDDTKDGIRYFIDVNLKGKQLDVEDIFKSYLFINDSSEEIRAAWYCFKKNAVSAERAKITYPLLKLLEHFFYCELYKDPKYKGLEFDDKFLLKSEFITKEDYPVKYRKGCHLVELIGSKKYMLNAFDKLNQTIEIMVQIVQSESLTSAFKDLFLTRKDRLQELELKIIHNFLKKALLDNSLLPKALVMKYILTTLRKNKKRAKEEYQRIYGVYLLSVLFVVFENKKSKDALLTVLKSNDLEWYQDAVKQINSYFSPDKITDTRLQAQFKLGMNEEEDNYKFRCKSLATIYNFFVVDDEKVFISPGHLQDLCRFITDDDTYSVEHFIINDSENRETIVTVEGEDHTYQYESSFFRKHVNSMFNYIFISQRVNSALKNYWLPEKLSIIEREYDATIQCAYSRMILQKVKALSLNMQKSVGHGDITDGLDLFFARDYTENYVMFARDVLKEIMTHIKQS